MLEEALSGKRNQLVSIGIAYKQEGNKSFVWMQRRSEQGRLNGKLEFPGGKIEKNETPAQALVREWKEEIDLSLNLNDFSLFKIYPYEYKDRKVTLYTFLVEKNFENKYGLWYEINEKIIESLVNEIPEANKKIFADMFEKKIL